MGFPPSLVSVGVGPMDRRCRLEPHPEGSLGLLCPEGCWRSDRPPRCRGDLRQGRGLPDRLRGGGGVRGPPHH
eukprot:8691494-Pyramimonas_sp.AAC.1